MFDPFVRGYLLHLALGVGLSAILWLAGLGLYALVDRRPGVAIGERLLAGYPFGLLLTVVTAAAVLHVPGGSGLAVLLAGALGLGVAAIIRQPAPWRRIVWSLGPVAVVALLLGLFNRGPSDALGAAGLSDVVWFAVRPANLAFAGFPRNLLVEGDATIVAQQGFGLIGAVLIDLPGFDPFLFNAVSGQVVFGIGVAVTLTAICPVATVPRAMVAVLLLLGAPVHPSWTVQSLPVVLVYPMFGLALRLLVQPPPLAQCLPVAAALAGAIFFSKLFAVVVLGPAVAWAIFAAAASRYGAWRAAGIAGALGLLAAALIGALAWQHRWSLAHFGFGHLPVLGPLLDGSAGREPLFRVVAVTLRDLGMAALVIGAWRTAARPVAALVTLGVGSIWIWPSPMAVALAGGVVIVALDLLQRASRGLAWPAMAGLLLAAHGAILEYNSPRVTAAILLAQALAFAAALLHPLRTIRAAGVCAALSVLPVLAMLWRFDQAIFAVVGRNWAMPMTPATFDMWRAVRARTPADALVFTDQTGPLLAIPGGLNHYPAIAGRQLYVSGWFASPLRSAEAALAERLALNEAVLAGSKRPAQLPLSHRYATYFAVVRADRPAPPDARELYRNAELALYALASE